MTRCQPHLREPRHRPLATLTGGCGGIQQRQLYIVERTSTRQQIKLLKHKTNPTITNRRQRIATHVRDFFTGQSVLAGGGCIQASQQIHEGRFTGAGRPHDGHELALAYRQRHTAQSRNGIGAHHIGFAQAANFNQGFHFGSEHARRTGHRRTLAASTTTATTLALNTRNHFHAFSNALADDLHHLAV